MVHLEDVEREAAKQKEALLERRRRLYRLARNKGFTVPEAGYLRSTSETTIEQIYQEKCARDNGGK
jgi:hypothetical protein